MCLCVLTTGAPDHTDPKCHICGKNTKRLLYHCSICKLNLDIDCMVDDMCARANLNMSWHHHPRLLLDFNCKMLCKVCGHSDGYGFFCPRCKLMVHDKCVSVFDSLEITHPFHVRHPLKLLTEGAPDYIDPECHVCGRDTESFLYHCDICKFNLDMVCVVEYHRQHTVTPVALSNLKVHAHTLTLIPRLIYFVCDACGTEGDRTPYVSLQCDLMFFHQDCASFPLVIYVNRREHRVSYTYPLGPGEWNCEICLEDIDWSYGAYSCSLCPTYALHSRCATRNDVWDGEDLDGLPEEVEDSEPCKMNDDNTITHFAHEHNMSLGGDDKSKPTGNRGRGRGFDNQGRGRGGRGSGFRAHNAQFSHAVGASEIPNFTPEQWASFSNFVSNQKQHSASEKLSGKKAKLYFCGNDSRFDIIIDSGASHHMTGDINLLTDVTTIDPCPFTMPNGQLTWATRHGCLSLGGRLVLHRVFYAPHLSITLISVAQLLNDVASFVLFTRKFCEIQDRTSKTLIGAGKEHDGVYYYTGEVAVQAGFTVPSYANIKTFGTLCYARRIARNGDKFGARGIRCLFLGYPLDKKALLSSSTMAAPHPILFDDQPETGSLPTGGDTSATSDTALDTMPYVTYASHTMIDPSHTSPSSNSESSMTANDYPVSYNQAALHDIWCKSMGTEVDALERNHSWDITTLPPASRNWELHQMDVHNAFLHGDLNEEVYMKLPPGFTSSVPNQVCKLKKSLYVLVYVDDLIIGGNDIVLISKLKKYLGECFHMKDLGPLKYFLGIEVSRGKAGIYLSQRKYALDIFSECGLLGAKPAPSLMEHNHTLARAEGDFYTDPTSYRRLVGRLVYLSVTRPELSYCIHLLAQFMQHPRQKHWEAALRVVSYLKGSPGQGLLLSFDDDLALSAYCDSDHAACPLTRHSVSLFC
ncbi:DC1 [Arabidopsis thaliana x Arabidopsis arenosa]|uniref:DC1 n=1 Tax=Arabidopsis thaliana x Arabidopsis arenosa TaxID=1240361 RepID=A0A8T1Z1U6_9BRAS|nr:DC1 [Arabidopsis thaliana x Arabidopsis arenosa]